MATYAEVLIVPIKMDQPLFSVVVAKVRLRLFSQSAQSTLSSILSRYMKVFSRK